MHNFIPSVCTLVPAQDNVEKASSFGRGLCSADSGLHAHDAAELSTAAKSIKVKLA